MYNLFGSIESPESMIITESDKLAFLDAILQREKTATIPPSIAIHFTSSESNTFNKTFVFLGFDFNEWHLRLFMYMINRYQKQKDTYALQDQQSLAELITILPRNKTALNEQSDPTASIADTIKQLEGFCEKNYKRKMRNLK